MARRYRRVSTAQQRELWARWKRGETLVTIGRALATQPRCLYAGTGARPDHRRHLDCRAAARDRGPRDPGPLGRRLVGRGEEQPHRDLGRAALALRAPGKSAGQGHPARGRSAPPPSAAAPSVRGTGARTRTRTGCFGSTFRTEWPSAPCITPHSMMARTNSIRGPVTRSATEHRPPRSRLLLRRSVELTPKK